MGPFREEGTRDRSGYAWFALRDLLQGQDPVFSFSTMEDLVPASRVKVHVRHRLFVRTLTDAKTDAGAFSHAEARAERPLENRPGDARAALLRVVTSKIRKRGRGGDYSSVQGALHIPQAEKR